MKKLLAALALIFTAYVASAQAGDVGVSISIGQPGFYGQIDIGGYGPPQVLYRQPVLVERRNWRTRSRMCARRPISTATGAGTAASITPARVPCISCAMTGIATCMRRAIARNMDVDMDMDTGMDTASPTRTRGMGTITATIATTIGATMIGITTIVTMIESDPISEVRLPPGQPGGISSCVHLLRSFRYP